MVNPQELKQAAFSKSFKGYSVSEVDEYIVYLTETYNELYAAYESLEAQYKSAVEALAEATDADVMATNTVKRAVASAEEIVAEANKKAEEMVDAATKRADEIKGSVSESCDKILDVYVTRVAEERDKLVKCEKAVAEFKDALYDAYRNHISMIDKIMPDVEPTPYFSDDELADKAMELAKDKLASASEIDE